jgi:hypothetical protein
MDVLQEDSLILALSVSEHFSGLDCYTAEEYMSFGLTLILQQPVDGFIFRLYRTRSVEEMFRIGLNKALVESNYALADVARFYIGLAQDTPIEALNYWRSLMHGGPLVVFVLDWVRRRDALGEAESRPTLQDSRLVIRMVESVTGSGWAAHELSQSVHLGGVSDPFAAGHVPFSFCPAARLIDQSIAALFNVWSRKDVAAARLDYARFLMVGGAAYFPKVLPICPIIPLLELAASVPALGDIPYRWLSRIVPSWSNSGRVADHTPEDAVPSLPDLIVLAKRAVEESDLYIQRRRRRRLQAKVRALGVEEQSLAWSELHMHLAPAKCIVCGAEENPETPGIIRVRPCSRCRNAQFCSMECAKVAWVRGCDHRNACTMFDLYLV